MKKYHLVLISVLMFMGVSPHSFADYPVASHRYLADPGAIVHNGRVYVYCSNDNENGDDGYDMSSIVCVSSSDLKNWTDHGVVFDVPEDASWTNLSWAPSPAYRDGKFYLYYGNGGSAIGVAEADNPLGPFTDPIDGPLADSNTPGVQPFDGWLFDPMTFIDDDGQAYMYFGGNGEDNLRVVRLNDDMISIDGEAEQFTVPDFFEAAWLHKQDGTYYFSYSSDPDAGMQIEYMTSDDPMSGFTYQGVISPQPPNNNNNNHQAIFQMNGQWYQMYHNRIVAEQNGDGTAYHRNLGIDAFDHREDGSIIEMDHTVDAIEQLGYLNPFERVEAETMGQQNGIETEVCSAGGMNVTSVDDDDWIMVEGVDFEEGAGRFSASVASEQTGGTIEVRLGSPDGTQMGTLEVPNTGGVQEWETVMTSLNSTSGVHDVYFVFKGSGGNLFNIDYWEFYASGPIVNITSPDNGDHFFVGDEVSVDVSAEAQEGSITEVALLLDGQSVGTDNTAPYSFTLTDLGEGNHILEAVATDSQDATDSSAISITVNIPQGPYNDAPHAVPGTIQAEEFDVGGHDYAYFDNTPDENEGGEFRTDEGVGIAGPEDENDDFIVGWTEEGEWLEYTVNVEEAGTYDITYRVASGGDGVFTLSFEGNQVDEVETPSTTADEEEWWMDYTYTDVITEEVTLQAGEQIMRLDVLSGGFNINYISLQPSVVTNLEDQETGSVECYPNPSSDAFHVEVSGSFHFRLTDINGNVLNSGASGEDMIIGRDVSPGIYLLHVIKREQTEVFKLVKN